MTKRVFVLIFLVSIVQIGVPRTAHADAWGTNIGAAVFKQTAEEVFQQLRDVASAAAKQAAIITLTNTIDSLIAGGSPRFVTNWNDYLYTQPQRATDIYMNDWFTLVTRGQASSSNYRAYNTVAGSEGIQNNSISYNQYLIQNARINTGIGGGGRQGQRVTTSEYCDNEFEPFSGAQGNNWRCFNALISNPLNNPIGFSLATQAERDEQLSRQRQIALLEQERGFLPTKDRLGNVLTPGSVVAELKFAGVTLPIKAIIEGDASVVASAMQAIASRFATRAILQGIGTVQQKVQREILQATGNVDRGVSQYADFYGPGAIFDPFMEAPPSGTTAKPWINPDTGKPVNTTTAKPWVNPDTLP